MRCACAKGRLRCSGGREGPVDARKWWWWRENSAMAANEGSRLQQFKASFDAFQFEIETRPQSSKLVNLESVGARPVDTGIQSLVKALQEEAFVLRGDLADWKRKSASGAQENANLKDELEKTTAQLQAEVEGWRDRAAMSAGKGIVARRQLEDFAKQVKTLTLELQKWKEVAAEHEEGEPSKLLQASLESVQKENNDLKAELNQWMLKAATVSSEVDSVKTEFNGTIKTLKADLDEWKQLAANSSDGHRLDIDELEHSVRELRVEVEGGTQLGQSENRLEGQRGNPVVEGCNAAEARKFSSQASQINTTKEWRDGPSDLEISLQAEVEDLKKKVLSSEELEISLHAEIEDVKMKIICAEKEHEQVRQRYESTVTELQVKVGAWKKRAASIAEDGKREQLGLETKLKESLVKVRDANDFASMERMRSAQELAGVQAELKDWKVIAADASEECSSLRVAFDNVIKELQVELVLWKEKAEIMGNEGQSLKTELVQWKEKAETMSAEGGAMKAELAQWKETAEAESKNGESVKAELTTVVRNLEKQVLAWKEKAESALEGMAKNQEEYAERVQTLDVELCLWRQRTQEGKNVQLELEEEQFQLKELLTKTQNELQNWKDRAAAALGVSTLPRQDDLCDGNEGGDDDSLSVLEAQLQKWRSRAQEGELLHSKLKNVLVETQAELYEWKQKAAAVTLATESLKEELDCVMEEGNLEREELNESIGELESGLCVWRERAQECQSLQTQLTISQVELKEWKSKWKISQEELKDCKDKVIAITLTTRLLMEELDFRTEEGLQEKQEFCISINALKESVLGWKAKAAENESMVSELNSALLETETALREWKDRATSVAMATESLKTEIDCTLEDYRLEKDELCSTIIELEAQMYEWKARCQENATAQRQLERALSEMERKKRPLLRSYKSGSSG